MKRFIGVAFSLSILTGLYPADSKARGLDVYSAILSPTGGAWGETITFDSKTFGGLVGYFQLCDASECLIEVSGFLDDELKVPARMTMLDKNRERTIYLVKLYANIELKGGPIEEILLVVDEDIKPGVGAFPIKDK